MNVIHGFKRWIAIGVIALTCDLFDSHTAHAPKPVAPIHTPAPHATPPPQLASRSADPVPPPPDVLFDGMAILTAYTGSDAGERGDEITASGERAVPYQTVAAWSDVPFGAVVEVMTQPRATYVVSDRGGAIGYAHLDVYIGHANVNDAMQFGVKRVHIRIYAP